MPEDPLTSEHMQGVLLRCAVRALRFARLCPNRTCRRYRRCRDLADDGPRCLPALHRIDCDRVLELLEMISAMVRERHAPTASDDAAINDLEHEALQVLFGCAAELPDLTILQDLAAKWRDRRKASAQPPTPPAPPPPPTPAIDAGAMAREMRAELKRMGIAVEPPGR